MRASLVDHHMCEGLQVQAIAALADGDGLLLRKLTQSTKNTAERCTCRKRITQASSSMATAPSLGLYMLVPECQSKALERCILSHEHKRADVRRREQG